VGWHHGRSSPGSNVNRGRNAYEEKSSNSIKAMADCSMSRGKGRCMSQRAHDTGVAVTATTVDEAESRKPVLRVVSQKIG